MAIDFSSIGATPAHTGKVDFSSIGGIPAVGQDEPTEETTALGAAGRGATGMIPLGEQAYSAAASTMEGKPYMQERQELEREIEADRANHPVARLAGQAAGLVAPALVTGGATAPESLLGAAGHGAVIGGGFGVGNAIDTLAGGGSGEKAAGDVALGAGLGALGGAAGQKIAGALGKAAPKLEEMAAKKAAQGVNMGSEELGHMSQQELIDTGKMLIDKGIVRHGASTQEMFDTAKALHEGYGDTIGRIGHQARELGLSTDIKPILADLEGKFQAADALHNPDERKAAIFYKRGMADILAMARKNLPETLSDVEGAPVPSDITFDQLQRLKRSYGNSAFESGAVKNQAAADVYGQISRAQKAIVNTARDNPELPSQLRDAMEGYSKLYPVVNGLQDTLGRERAGNLPAKGFGMMGKLVGQLPGQKNPAINALTALGLMGAGHPMWALGAATATLQNPRAMSGMAQGVADAIPAVAEGLPTMGSQMVAKEAPASTAHKIVEHATEHGIHHTAETAIHQNMGETKPARPPESTLESPGKKPSTALDVDHPAMAQWKPVFQRNAATAKNAGEVEKADAVTDFVLSQRDPTYAAAKKRAKDSPQEKAPQGMAEGGVVPENEVTEPMPELGSTLQGLADQLRKPTHESPVREPEALPTRSTQRFHQPFNTDMEDKLRAFLGDGKGRGDGKHR